MLCCFICSSFSSQSLFAQLECPVISSPKTFAFSNRNGRQIVASFGIVWLHQTRRAASLSFFSYPTFSESFYLIDLYSYNIISLFCIIVDNLSIVYWIFIDFCSKFSTLINSVGSYIFIFKDCTYFYLLLFIYFCVYTFLPFF